MRRREEQRRKFHEALIKMLYPPPPEPSLIEEERNEIDDDPQKILPLPDDGISDQELDEEKSSSDGGGDGKLTRAQRKRLRKRKLKEDSLLRGNMIGPLLPLTGEEDEPRQNVIVNCNLDIKNDETGDGMSSSGKNKVKQRRKARKLVKTMPESAFEKINGDAEAGGHSSS